MRVRTTLIATLSICAILRCGFASEPTETRFPEYRFVTSGPNVQDMWPCFSPGSHSLLFTRSTDGEDSTLFTVSINGGQSNPFPAQSPATGTRANWSAKHNFIAFNAQPTKGRFNLSVIHGDGSGLRVLESVALSDQMTYPSWYPDGKSVAVVDFAGNEASSIKRIDIEKGTVVTLTDPKTHWAGVPRVSPNGNTIVMGGQVRRGQRYSQYENQIFFLNQDGELRLLDSKRGWAPYWSPDGKWIAFFAQHAPDDKARGIAIVQAEAALALISSKSMAVDLDQFFQPPAKYANDLGDYASPLKFYNGSEVKTAEDWQRRRKEILGRWHMIMGPWPPLLEKTKIEYLKTERREDFTQHRVRVEVALGLMHSAILLVPDGEGPFPAAVVPYYDEETGAGLGKELRDFGYQLTKRGFVTLSIGACPPRRDHKDEATIQRLSFESYVAANCHTALANLKEIDARRIGIVGHSYGGKWAMFASCLYEKFACAAWSDGGIVFDEQRGNVNYWEPWYLGYEPNTQRQKGIPTENNPRTGAYKTLVELGHDLHELHALMAPRPFLVSGGAEDQPERWKALNHAIAVNRLLGYRDRVAMTNRLGHPPTNESNEQIYQFLERYLKKQQ